MKTLALGLLVALGALARKDRDRSDQAVDFSKFRTFAIRDSRLNSKNPALNNDLVKKTAGCGYRKISGGEGTVFVESGPSLTSTFAIRSARCERLSGGVSGGLARLGHAGRKGALHRRHAGDRLRDPTTRSLVGARSRGKRRATRQRSRPNSTIW